MMKNKLISADTLRNRGMVEAMTKLKTVNDETLIEMAKDPHLAEAFKQSMVHVVETENTKGDFSTANEDGEKLRRSLALVAKGGKVKDASGVERNAVDIAYDGARTTDSEAAASRFIVSEGKNLSSYKYGLPGAAKVDDLYADKISTGGLATALEKNPVTTEETVKRIRAKGLGAPAGSREARRLESVDKNEILNTLG